MQKTITVTFDPTHGVAHKLNGLFNSSSWNCETEETMLLVGLLTMPPRYTGLSMIHYWAWLKYSAAIHRPTNSLKLRRILEELDPHQKTVLADDFGIGFPCHYLIDQHGFEDFADTGFLLEHLFAGVVSTASKPKRGPSKLPDFVAVDATGGLHILECKGTQDSRSYLSKALASGMNQKSNLSNGGIFSSCMVGGIYIPRFTAKKDAEIVFVDPEPVDLNERFATLEKEDVARAVRRVSLAKTLAAAGLVHSATTILLGKVSDVDLQFLRRAKSSELELSGYVRKDKNFWERTLKLKSFEPSDSNQDSLVPVTTSVTTRIPVQLMSAFRESLGNNGELPSKEVDDWIKDIVQERRSKREVTVTVQSETKEKKLKTVTRSFSSTWQNGEGLFEKGQSGLSTGLGFQFIVSTTKR